jgi:uncharacterized Zn finger protein
MSITLRSRRGAIATTWHGRALQEVFEAGVFKGTVNRGRRLARSGAVDWLDVGPGCARAAVQVRESGAANGGSGGQAPTADAMVQVTAYSPDDQVAALKILRRHPELGSRLSAGTYPEAIERTMQQNLVPLIPRGATDFSHHCSCPEFPGPCVHVMALLYVLVEAVDEHPVHLLTLRGLTIADIVPGAAERSVPDGHEPHPSDDSRRAGTGDVDATESVDRGETLAPNVNEPPAFDPVIADASHLTRVLGAPQARLLAEFYRSGTGSSTMATTAEDDPPSDAPSPP